MGNVLFNDNIQKTKPKSKSNIIPYDTPDWYKILDCVNLLRQKKPKMFTNVYVQNLNDNNYILVRFTDDEKNYEVTDSILAFDYETPCSGWICTRTYDVYFFTLAETKITVPIIPRKGNPIDFYAKGTKEWKNIEKLVHNRCATKIVYINSVTIQQTENGYTLSYTSREYRKFSSAIIAYDYDTPNSGWAYTVSGSLYFFGIKGIPN